MPNQVDFYLIFRVLFLTFELFLDRLKNVGDHPTDVIGLLAQNFFRERTWLIFELESVLFQVVENLILLFVQVVSKISNRISYWQYLLRLA